MEVLGTCARQIGVLSASPLWSSFVLTFNRRPLAEGGCGRARPLGHSSHDGDLRSRARPCEGSSCEGERGCLRSRLTVSRGTLAELPDELAGGRRNPRQSRPCSSPREGRTEARGSGPLSRPSSQPPSQSVERAREPLGRSSCRSDLRPLAPRGRPPRVERRGPSGTRLRTGRGERSGRDEFEHGRHPHRSERGSTGTRR